MISRDHQDIVDSSSRDPKMAMMFVSKSRGKKQAAPETTGSGYSSAQTDAIKSRLQGSALKKKSSSPTEDKATKNKLNGY